MASVLFGFSFSQGKMNFIISIQQSYLGFDSSDSASKPSQTDAFLCKTKSKSTCYIGTCFLTCRIYIARKPSVTDAFDSSDSASKPSQIDAFFVKLSLRAPVTLASVSLRGDFYIARKPSVTHAYSELRAVQPLPAKWAKGPVLSSRPPQGGGGLAKFVSP